MFQGPLTLLCVCLCLSLWAAEAAAAPPGGLGWLRGSKQISSSVSCRLKSNCQNKDAKRAFKRNRSIPSCVSVELFWGSLVGRVKVYFVFAAGPQHKASGSWLVKCWWRYYKVKSRVYKPAVCMVRAFPAEQWVSELVWQWRRQTQREIEGERTRKWETVAGSTPMLKVLQLQPRHLAGVPKLRALPHSSNTDLNKPICQTTNEYHQTGSVSGE